MNCMIWNTQRAWSRALSEPHILGAKAQEVCDSLGFSDNVCVEAVGASGGIWLLWNAAFTSVQIVLENPYFIYVIVKCAGVDVHLNVIYAPSMRTGALGPMVFFDDSPVFADIIGPLDLIDMGFLHSKYTWRRGPEDAPTIFRRLDRVFTNVQGRLCGQEVVVCHLLCIKSDHNALLLSLDPSLNVDGSRHPFRFEAMWTLHPRFFPFVEPNWKHDINTTDALSLLKDDLRTWNKEVFGHLNIKKNKPMHKNEGNDRALGSCTPSRLLKLQCKLKVELERVLLQEKMLWRRRKSYMTLKDSARVTEKYPLEQMVVGFYRDLYLNSATGSLEPSLPRGGFPPISHGDTLSLLTQFSDEEI
ncbi:LOW QUALITY PROTEIN: hypothetical protein V2J09_021923 [Rumex salicifolius]